MLKKAQLLQLETLALHPSSRDISIQRCDLDVIVAEKMKSFARLASNSSAIRENLSRNRTGQIKLLLQL